MCENDPKYKYKNTCYDTSGKFGANIFMGNITNSDSCIVELKKKMKLFFISFYDELNTGIVSVKSIDELSNYHVRVYPIKKELIWQTIH